MVSPGKSSSPTSILFAMRITEEDFNQNFKIPEDVVSPAIDEELVDLMDVRSQIIIEGGVEYDLIKLCKFSWLSFLSSEFLRL